MMGYGWGMGANGWVWMIVGLAILVVVVLLLVRALGGADRGSGRSADRAPDEMDILRGRLARGEITEAEFEQTKRLLGSDR